MTPFSSSWDSCRHGATWHGAWAWSELWSSPSVERFITYYRRESPGAAMARGGDEPPPACHGGRPLPTPSHTSTTSPWGKQRRQYTHEHKQVTLSEAVVAAVYRNHLVENRTLRTKAFSFPLKAFGDVPDGDRFHRQFRKTCGRVRGISAYKPALTVLPCVSHPIKLCETSVARDYRTKVRSV